MPLRLQQPLLSDRDQCLAVYGSPWVVSIYTLSGGMGRFFTRGSQEVECSTMMN